MHLHGTIDIQVGYLVSCKIKSSVEIPVQITSRMIEETSRYCCIEIALAFIVLKKSIFRSFLEKFRRLTRAFMIHGY